MKTCHRMLMLVLTGLMIVSYFPINNVFAASYMQTKANTNLQGIDVSHWNGSINWPQVKNSGIAFAYIKASDGNDSIDPLFSTNVESARATNLPIGAYHYAR